MEETMTAAATPSEQPVDHTQTPNAGEPADVPAEDTTIESAEGQASNGSPSLSGTPTGGEATEPDGAGETEGEKAEKNADVISCRTLIRLSTTAKWYGSRHQIRRRSPPFYRKA